MQNLIKERMNTLHRILRYLKNAPKKGLMYSNNEAPTFEGYTDIDWDGECSFRRLHLLKVMLLPGEVRNI